MAFSNTRTLCLALHTDLGNIDNYADNPALLAALVLTAEEKVSSIIAHLIEVRASIGMRGSAAIINAHAA